MARGKPFEWVIRGGKRELGFLKPFQKEKNRAKTTGEGRGGIKPCKEKS